MDIMDLRCVCACVCARAREMHSIGPGQGAAAGTCEYDNEPSGSTEGGEFLDQPNYHSKHATAY
jgi:hypothetical protein